MLARRSRFPFIVVTSLMLMAACSRADSTSLPPAVQALAAQGLAVKKEFDAGNGIRAFAAIVNDRPVAVYVLADGNAIVGTRLNANGEPLDDAKLEKLVAKPMSEKDWERLKTSTWVLDGKSDAPRIVYVFTDANCPYCHRFWEAARPWVDAGKVQIRDILVGVIKEDSPAKAAAILDAPDPRWAGKFPHLWAPQNPPPRDTRSMMLARSGRTLPCTPRMKNKRGCWSECLEAASANNYRHAHRRRQTSAGDCPDYGS